jgi:hypothetical protein
VHVTLIFRKTSVQTRAPISPVPAPRRLFCNASGLPACLLFGLPVCTWLHITMHLPAVVGSRTSQRPAGGYHNTQAVSKRGGVGGGGGVSLLSWENMHPTLFLASSDRQRELQSTSNLANYSGLS